MRLKFALLVVLLATCITHGAALSAETAFANANMNNELANWSFHSAWDKQNGYKLGVDKENTFNGHRAAYLQSQQPAQAPDKFFAVATQNFKADKFRGKRIQFCAFLKTGKVTGSAGLWIKARKSNHVLAFADSGDNGINQTTDWKRYSATLNVPAEADLLTLGVYLTGGGKVWFTDLSVAAVSNSVQTTEKAWDAKKYWRFADELKAKPLNLDFSQRTADPTEMLDWTCHTSPSPGKCGIDREMVFNGKPSAFVEQQSQDPTDFVASYQDISAADYAGKRVKLSALLKTKGVTDWTALWLRVDGDNKVLAFDNMEDRPIKGDTDWAPYSVVLDVPANATRIRLGFMQAGSGKSWMNSASFSTVDKNVPVTAAPTAEPTPLPADAQRTTPDLEFHSK